MAPTAEPNCSSKNLGWWGSTSESMASKPSSAASCRLATCTVVQEDGFSRRRGCVPRCGPMFSSAKPYSQTASMCVSSARAEPFRQQEGVQQGTCAVVHQEGSCGAGSREWFKRSVFEGSCGANSCGAHRETSRTYEEKVIPPDQTTLILLNHSPEPPFQLRLGGFSRSGF